MKRKKLKKRGNNDYDMKLKPQFELAIRILVLVGALPKLLTTVINQIGICFPVGRVGIIVVSVMRLLKPHIRHDVDRLGSINEYFLSYNWSNNQRKENDKHEKVNDRKSDDSLLSELRLLGGVYWWSNLAGWAQPEQHSGVNAVRIREQDNGQLKEQYNMSKDKICREHSKFRDLTQQLTTRLRDSMRSKTIPLSVPECQIALVCLELSGEGKRDDKLIKPSLNRNHRNHS